MACSCPSLDSNSIYIAFSNPNPSQVVTNAELLDPEPELIDPKSDDNTIELRKSGIVKRGPKSHKQGYSISTNEKIALEIKAKRTHARFWKTKKLGTRIDETSIKPDLNDNEPGFDYFDYDKVIAEPGLYSCENSNSCTGKIETDHHYFLKCWSCNK